MTTPSGPSLPRVVGGFRLVRELGRGGMGIVYEAEELSSRRIVALKVLAAELAVEGEAFERFRREAKLAASISDVRCVFVYGAHQIDEAPAISMELVGGRTLQERINAGTPIPIETAVRWTLDIIDGLEAAHEVGVLHRDVKPSNCFLTPDDRVKIGDFGLSRSLERDIELTQSGQFLGSPLYASPEQVRGRAVDARSDQYSCGATLYALLTGRAPFGGSNIGEVLARILSEPPPRPSSLRADIPLDLEKVLLRAVDREPARRFRSLQAFREALEPFAGGETVAAPRLRRIGAWLVDGTVVTLAVGALVAYLKAREGDVAPDPDRPWIPLPFWLQALASMLPIFYYGLLEGWRGSALGKWLFGLRVTTVGPGPGLLARALLRSTIYEIPAFVTVAAMYLLVTSHNGQAILSLTVTLAGFAFRACTMRRRNGWRGPHELWSGTRVVRSALAFRRVRRVEPPPEAQAEPASGVPGRVGEYRVLGVRGNTRSGLVLHARDEQLERSVWIQLREAAPASSDLRRAVVLPARLRWLESLRVGTVESDIFEAPGGCSLRDLEGRELAVEWPLIERTLSALLEELVRCEREAGRPLRWSRGQIWFDRQWNVRLLDEPLLPDVESDLSSLDVLAVTARALVGSGKRRELPADLPLHAEPLMRALLGSGPPFPDLEAVRAQIAASQAEPASIDANSRWGQLAVGSLLLTLMVGLGMVLYLIIVDFMPHAIEVGTLLKELRDDKVAVAVEGIDPPALDEAGVRDRQLVLSYELTHGWGGTLLNQMDEERIALCDAARKAFPSPSDEEMRAAQERILAERSRASGGTAPGHPPELEFIRSSKPSWALVLFGASGSATWALTALFSCILWPAGLSFRLFGLALRRRNGRRAGRWFGLARAMLIAVPLAAAYTSASTLLVTGSPVAAWLVFGVTAAVHAIGVGLAILHPSRGPIDRLLGSRIVPR